MSLRKDLAATQVFCLHLKLSVARLAVTSTSKQLTFLVTSSSTRHFLAERLEPEVMVTPVFQVARRYMDKAPRHTTSIIPSLPITIHTVAVRVMDSLKLPTIGQTNHHFQAINSREDMISHHSKVSCLHHLLQDHSLKNPLQVLVDLLQITLTVHPLTIKGMVISRDTVIREDILDHNISNIIRVVTTTMVVKAEDGLDKLRHLDDGNTRMVL